MRASKAYLPIRGTQVYYETLGDGEPVLLLHGDFGTVEDFAMQTPELAKHFKTIALEQVGHGRTPDNGEPFHYSTMADNTIGFMESLGMVSANLVGWSGGANVALLVAISRPDLVKRIVSVSGNFNTSYTSARSLDWLRSVTPETFRSSSPRILKHYDEAAPPDGPAHYPVVFEKMRKMWVEEPDIRKEELATIGARTLVMAGDRDIISLEHTTELFRSIRGAQLCIIPNATHFLLSDRPDATNRAIMEFLVAEETPK